MKLQIAAKRLVDLDSNIHVRQSGGHVRENDRIGDST